MKNQLEDFIRQNKAAFDDQEPSEKIWKNIRQQLFITTSLWNSVVIWRAAAVVLLGLCIYLAIQKIVDNRDKNLALSEFNDVENFYVSQISEKVEQIKASRGQDMGMNGFTHDFQQLEAMYQVLKEEMRARPSQKVKDALELNLLIRIDLLNQQLHKIEEGEESGAESKINT
ncbi:MAG TPA: hypothetical protein VGK39_07125 [Cyclobacteriaceae bacterium]